MTRARGVGNKIPPLLMLQHRAAVQTLNKQFKKTNSLRLTAKWKLKYNFKNAICEWIQITPHGVEVKWNEIVIAAPRGGNLTQTKQKIYAAPRGGMGQDETNISRYYGTRRNLHLEFRPDRWWSENVPWTRRSSSLKTCKPKERNAAQTQNGWMNGFVIYSLLMEGTSSAFLSSRETAPRISELTLRCKDSNFFSKCQTIRHLSELQRDGITR